MIQILPKGSIGCWGAGGTPAHNPRLQVEAGLPRMGLVSHRKQGDGELPLQEQGQGLQAGLLAEKVARVQGGHSS